MDAKTLCLGVLARGPATGYDIRKAFQTGPFSHFCGAGFGSIYPALRKLSDEGLIAETSDPTSSREKKKVFHITEAGRENLRRELGDPAPLGLDLMRSEFMFRIFFAHMLPKSRIQSIIEERKAFYHQKLSIIDSVLKKKTCRPGERFIAEMGKSLILCALAFLETHAQTLLQSPLLSDLENPS